MHLFLPTCLCLGLPPWPTSAADAILAFSRTEGFGHDSIPTAVDTLRTVASEQGLRTVHSEDSWVSPYRLCGNSAR